MAIRRKSRSLGQLGNEHLQLCRDLVVAVDGLIEATSAAARSLPPAEIRRACASPENSAHLLYAVVEEYVDGTPPGPAASYVFHASIFAATVRAGVAEPLLSMAGESAADDLTLMLLMALESDNYEFILQGAGNMLDAFGDMLGQAYYKVQASGFRIAAIKDMNRDRPSAIANLDIETRLESHRMAMRKLLPLARRECEGDESRNGLLDTFEKMLGSVRHMPPVRQPVATPDQKAEAVGSIRGRSASGEATPVQEEEFKPARPPTPTGAPLDGREVSAMAADAFRHAASRLRPGEPLNTLRLFIALESFDMSSHWERLWLETGDAGFLATLEFDDPEPGPGGTWDTVPLTGTCTRSLHVAVRLCDTYSMWPVPVGAVALALVADPESSAAQALMARGSLNHAGLIELLQEITLGGEYENIGHLLATAIYRPGKTGTRQSRIHEA